MTDYISDIRMNMDIVISKLRPWTDKEGKVSYVEVGKIIDECREIRNYDAHSFYDWEDMCASPGRVMECIERNIIPKTKAFIDEDGFVHIYGYALGDMGRRLGLLDEIVESCRHFYGYATEEERQSRKDDIGKSGNKAKVGDIVEIVKGRKQVGYVFEVARTYKYYTSGYRWATEILYLIDRNGFKVNADNCAIADVGYTC